MRPWECPCGPVTNTDTDVCTNCGTQRLSESIVRDLITTLLAPDTRVTLTPADQRRVLRLAANFDVDAEAIAHAYAAGMASRQSRESATCTADGEVHRTQSASPRGSRTAAEIADAILSPLGKDYATGSERLLARGIAEVIVEEREEAIRRAVEP